MEFDPKWPKPPGEGPIELQMMDGKIIARRREGRGYIFWRAQRLWADGPVIGWEKA